MIGNGAQWPVRRFPMWVYQGLPCRRTKPKSMWSCMWRALPILTGSCARGAKVHGGFGLVVPRFTNAYQPSDLAPGRPHVAFTNLRLRQKE